MGTVKRQVYNEQLMASADYNNLNTLRHLISNLNSLKQLEARGDQVAGAIVVDIELALENPELLTEYQRTAIVYNLVYGLNQYDTAEIMCVSQRTVSNFVTGGLKRIRKFLTKGRPEDA